MSSGQCIFESGMEVVDHKETGFYFFFFPYFMVLKTFLKIGGEFQKC
jgi:hypothetical protein